jgi:hypothetical protein
VVHHAPCVVRVGSAWCVVCGVQCAVCPVWCVMHAVQRAVWWCRVSCVVCRVSCVVCRVCRNHRKQARTSFSRSCAASASIASAWCRTCDDAWRAFVSTSSVTDAPTSLSDVSSDRTTSTEQLTTALASISD